MNTYLVYAIVLVLFIFFILIAILIGTLFKKYKEKIFELLKSLKDEIVWNGIIQSISIAYLNQAIGLFIVYDMLFDENSDNTSLTIFLSILAFLIGYILIVGRHIRKNRKRLNDEIFMQNIQKMYPDVFLEKVEG